MNKTEMKRAAKAITARHPSPFAGWGVIACDYNVSYDEINENNPRFNWLLEQSQNAIKNELNNIKDKAFNAKDEISNGLIEASMLLSEASRKDFEYQEENNGC